MALRPQEHDPIDPDFTANFLRSQEKVVAAEAWVRGESVLARVTVAHDAQVTETDLLNACLREIGPKNTPKAIWLDRSVRPAA